jgi:hypothetical protein
MDLAAVVVISIETGRTWLGLGFSFGDVPRMMMRFMMG